jgi:hypothetical protein
VFCEVATGVDRVTTGGWMVVEGGAVLGFDMHRLAGEAAGAAAHLAGVNAGARALVQALEPIVLDVLRRPGPKALSRAAMVHRSWASKPVPPRQMRSKFCAGCIRQVRGASALPTKMAPRVRETGDHQRTLPASRY